MAIMFLPLLSGDRFIGRAEVVNDRKRRTLEVRRLCTRMASRATRGFAMPSPSVFQRVGEFNACEAVEMMDDGRL